MNPLLRIVLVVMGGCLGAMLGASMGAVGAVLGALAALGIAEFSELRSRVVRLEADLERLGKSAQPEASTAPLAPVAPVAREAPQTTAATIEIEPEPRLTPTPQRRNETPFAEITGMGTVFRFFTGGNTVVRMGVVILFFGVAFLLRYMAEHTRVPVEVRLTAIALGAMILLIVGWRLRTTREGYALALQGGGIGILYLTVFAALRLYAILPAAVAFPMLALIATFSAILAVKQDSMSFALLGITGGFLAPVLASNGEGSHIVLFSYYALLNAGILAMAWYKTWRPLNIAGFVFTFAIGSAWGALRYRPDEFASTEPFLILFFWFYFSIAILFSVRQPVNLKGFVDATLVFGTPIVVFAFQSLLLSDRLMTLAFSAIGMSTVYLTAAWITQRRRNATQSLMIEAFIAIGISFLTLAVPLALDASWNAAAWTMEGMALVWAGCRQNRVLARTAGALLIVASVGITTFKLDFGAAGFVMPLRSCFGLVLQSVAAIFAAQILHAHRGHLRNWECSVPHALFWLGLFTWSGAGLSEISLHWPTLLISGWLALATFTALACSTLYRITRFDDAKSAALLQLPVMVAMAIGCANRFAHPFEHFGWLAWPIAFIALYLVMYRHEGAPSERLAPFLETAAAWLFCSVFSWEAAWTVNQGIAGGEAWETAAWIVIPAIFLLLLPRLVKRVDWPFVKNGDAYLFVAGVGVAGCLCVWSVWTSVTSSGDSAPLPYVPLFNPLDLAEALVLSILLHYGNFLGKVECTRFPRFDLKMPLRIVSALGFIWLNAALLRTLHEWFGVALDPQAMMNSTLVQTSVSILWASIAFVTMLLGARRRRRNVWIVGAVLLGVVIAKLFLVDLSRIGSIERIVSFVGVGLLMLVVGYLSPLPPADESAP